MKSHQILVAVICIVFIGVLAWLIMHSSSNRSFDGNKAFQNLNYQVSLGPRIPGSKAHLEILNWMAGKLVDAGWKVETQEFSGNGIPGTNLIAKRGTSTPWIIIGTHYDSRLYADRDPVFDNRNLPVPGANDGASGVATLLELARVLPANLDKQVWLVFFDLEDQGGIGNWDWILGSRTFVDTLQSAPDSVIIIDMVGDADLNLYYENNSNQELSRQIWSIASFLGFGEYFILEEKYSILDDHTPFIEKGISAIDIIDFDYPYYHSTSDTPDKTNAKSLYMVGMTLVNWLSR
jgi:Zn-dependent M28 family amino/carboxypeptidase